MKNNHTTSMELDRELDSMRGRLVRLEECRTKLEEEQQRYRQLLNAAPDAMIFVNHAGRIMRVNAQFEKLFGYEKDELNGRQLEILVPHQFRKKHQQFVGDFFHSPRKRPMGMNYEIYGLKKNGEEFPADISLSYLEIGDELLASAAVRDITERKQAEEKIARDYHIQRVISAVLKISLEPLSLEEHLQRILEHILSIPQLALEQKGGIYLIDRREEMLLLKASKGFDEKELLPCRELALGECLCGKAARDCTIIYADCIDDRHRRISQDQFPHGHYCIPIEDGDEAVGLINLFVREGHKRSEIEEKFLTVIADTLAGVLRHHRSEDEKDQLLTKLADSEKMAALGRLTSNFSHEIRNPLTAIGGLARRMVKTASSEESEERKYAEKIVEEVERLEALIKNLVVFSGSYNLPPQKHDLVAIIKARLSLISDVCRRQGIAVRTDFAEIPKIFVDGELMEMIMDNLFANAIEAMPEGGALTVSAVERHIPAGDFTVVQVGDTGKGIAEEKIDRVFEPLFTTKTASSRPGLGLASTRKILEAHGGAISVQSEEGAGTTFTITLPIKESLPPADYSI